jgi:phytoene desaturase
MDTIEGVWFPEGGMHAAPLIMAQVAEKAGG